MRLICALQYPTPMRYQSWWFDELPKHFREYFGEVVVLGLNDLNRIVYQNDEMFSPIDAAIEFEHNQIQDFMSMELREDDALWISDISFPGLFCNVLYHKRPKHVFGYCHATSLNRYDYFQPVRKSKFATETAHSKLFDKIFIGSNYHKNKLGWKWDNVEVVGLPDPPVIKRVNCEKRYNVVSVCRPSIQKVNKKLEKKVERALGLKIVRKEVNSWEEYSRFLSESMILLSTTKEDTFNYTIVDAIKCGCIPFAPWGMAFPELIGRPYMYNSADELIKRIGVILDQTHCYDSSGYANIDLEGFSQYNPYYYCVPQLRCQNLVDNFYENVCESMHELILGELTQ